jgi:hypothetical protein
MFRCVLIKNVKTKRIDKNITVQHIFVIVYLSYLLYHRGHAKPNETVLIHGASGGVSLRKKKKKLIKEFFASFFFLIKGWNRGSTIS